MLDDNNTERVDRLMYVVEKESPQVKENELDNEEVVPDLLKMRKIPQKNVKMDLTTRR